MNSGQKLANIKRGRDMLKRMARIGILAVCASCWTAASAQSLKVFMLPSCPVTQPAKAAGEGKKMAVLAGLVLEQVISKGVDIASTALAAAAKDKVTTLTGESSSTTYYEVNEKGAVAQSADLGCIVLLTGGANASDVLEWMSRATAAPNFMNIKNVPDFYLEIAIQNFTQDAGLKATPTFLYVGKTLAPGNGWFRKREKDYVVAVSLNAEASGSAFGAMTFSFKNVDTGSAYVQEQPDGLKDELKMLPDWPIASRLAKLPETDEVKEAVSARKTVIADYMEANAILKRKAFPVPLVKQPIDSETNYHAAVLDLCRQIDTANKAPLTAKGDKAEAARFSDPRCPINLWNAKLAVDKASTKAQTDADLTWANSFFAAKCAAVGKFKDHPANPAIPSQAYQSCELPAFESGRPKVGDFFATATVAETSEASAFLKALASAFAEDKDKLKTALNDRLNPVRREELEAEKTASERSARQKYQLALLKVSQIDASLQEASGGTLSSRKLIEIQMVQAKIDANAAARAAGVSVPFADYD